MPQPKTMTNEATIERDFMRYRFLLLNCLTVCDKALVEGRPRASGIYHFVAQALPRGVDLAHPSS